MEYVDVATTFWSTLLYVIIWLMQLVGIDDNLLRRSVPRAEHVGIMLTCSTAVVRSLHRRLKPKVQPTGTKQMCACENGWPKYMLALC